MLPLSQVGVVLLAAAVDGVEGLHRVLQQAFHHLVRKLELQSGWGKGGKGSNLMQTADTDKKKNV